MYGLVMDMDFPMCGLSVAAQLEHGTRSQSRMDNSFGPQGSQDRLRDYRVSSACKSCLIKRCPGSQASKPVVCPGKAGV